MADFADGDIEIQDVKNSDPEHFNSSVATAGVSVTITPTSTDVIQWAYINVPSKRHPVTPNNINDALYISLDGGTNYTVLMSGESLFLPGITDSIEIDSNEDGVNYEIIVWT